MLSRNRLTLLLLVLFIAAFVVLWDQPPQTLLGDDDGEAKKIRYPATYMTNMHTREFTADGFLGFELNAELAEVYGTTGNRKKKQAARGNTLLTKPYMQLHDPDEPTWYATSNKGIANNDGGKIELRGAVKVWFTNQNGEKTQLDTTSLIFFPNREYAETDKPVRITTAQGTTDAVGMKLFIKEQRIQLLNKVQGYYETI